MFGQIYQVLLPTKKFWEISPKSCQNYHFSPIKTTVNFPDIYSCHIWVTYWGVRTLLATCGYCNSAKPAQNHKEREKPKQSKTLQMHFSADVTEPLEIHQDVETTRPSCLQHVAHVHHTQRGGGESKDSTEKCFVTITEPQNIHFLPSSIFWGEL